MSKLYNILATTILMMIIATACKTNQHENTFKIDEKIQLKGTIVCLPKKGEGPVTMECAFGLQVDSTYYGLKSLPSEALKDSTVRTGNLVKVTGTVVNIGKNGVYKIAAAIKVKTITLLKDVPKNKNDLKRYKHAAFIINYPAGWLKKDNKNSSWSFISPQAGGTVLATFHSPADYLENTNFGFIQISISTSDNSKAIQNCSSPLDNLHKTTKLMINGTEFTRIAATDAATGDRYLGNSYRTVRNGQCWAIETVLNYSPIGFYGENSGIKTFNRKAVEERIERIIQSFRFKK